MNEHIDFSGSGVVAKLVESDGFLIMTRQVGQTMRHIICKDAILLFLRDALFLIVLFNACHCERRWEWFGRNRSEYGSESQCPFVVWWMGIYTVTLTDCFSHVQRVLTD